MRYLLAALSVIVLGAQLTNAAPYRADLGPMPLDDETKAFIAGRGEAVAEAAGDMLTISGRFAGLPSSATVAHIMLSPAIGVPGKELFTVDVAGANEGTISGSHRLSRAQMQALRSGRLYVQIDSEKAPPGYSWGPKGTLWGWLLPDHPRAEPGEPQQGSWFIPQYAVSER